MIEEAACLGCQEEEVTLHHLYFVCKATRDGGRTLSTNTWQHVAEQQPGSLLWTRALARDPSREWPPLETKEEVHWRLAPGQEPLFEGSAFSDGPRCGNTEHAMVGWSVAGMEGMEPKVVAFGPVPTKLPVQRRIKRAELFAFLQLLRFSQPPVRAVTDHLGILQGLKKGEQWCTAATRAHADVWRLV